MRAGVVIDQKYRLIRELGAGGMGAVWLASHVVTERPFAIKLLHAHIAANPEMRARFVQEAKALGKLRHPSIVEVIDVGVEAALGGTPFLVMELLDGAPLDVALRRLGRLPAPLALEVVLGVARALGAAHAAGIVHRDLKPANVFLHRPGTGAIVPKVLDFGISKWRRDDPGHALTQTGSVLGSPLYMSPEQAASDKTLDARSDVHALGVVLWECLVGKPPFVAETYNTLVVEIMTGARPRLRDALPDASDEVARIVERAFARAREERFTTAEEMASAIEAELARMGLASTLDTRTAAADLFRSLEAGAPPAVPSRPQLVASPPGLPPASPVADTVSAQPRTPADDTLASAGVKGSAPLKWPWVGVAGSAMIFAAGFLLFVRSSHRAPSSTSLTAPPPAAAAPAPQQGEAPRELVTPAPPPPPAPAPVDHAKPVTPRADAGAPPRPVTPPNAAAR
jgi:eukaryotic-like serine/threonine-protein kinase